MTDGLLDKVITDLTLHPILTKGSIGITSAVQHNSELALREIGDRLVLEMNSYVMGDRLATHKEELAVDVPTNIWQYFKWECFDPKGWFLRRWPVKMRTIRKKIKVESFASFPELPEVYPKPWGRPVQVQLLSTEETGKNG